LLNEPGLEWKSAAFSQFLLGRFGRTETIEGEQMGYAIRTDRYRYVEWYRWDAEGKKPEELLHRELFDHLTDPHENINLAADPALGSLADSMALQLDRGWRHSLPGNNQKKSKL
jgi:arylsulfatase A-like enzyme